MHMLDLRMLISEMSFGTMRSSLRHAHAGSANANLGNVFRNYAIIASPLHPQPANLKADGTHHLRSTLELCRARGSLSQLTQLLFVAVGLVHVLSVHEAA